MSVDDNVCLVRKNDIDGFFFFFSAFVLDEQLIFPPNGGQPGSWDFFSLLNLIFFLNLFQSCTCRVVETAEIM